MKLLAKTVLVSNRPALFTLLFVFILFSISATTQTDEFPNVKELPNLGRVNARLFRGGQPREGGIEKLAQLGVKTIINLRDDDERAKAEAVESRAAGLRYFNVPFKHLGRPTTGQLDQVLSLIDSKENGVVFIHCRRGADRTGVVIAIYRMSRENWTYKDALAEAERFGLSFWQRGMRDYISDYFRDKAGNSRSSP
jgi:protein tyrosine/serine phosphatase